MLQTLPAAAGSAGEEGSGDEQEEISMGEMPGGVTEGSAHQVGTPDLPHEPMPQNRKPMPQNRKPCLKMLHLLREVPLKVLMNPRHLVSLTAPQKLQIQGRIVLEGGSSGSWAFQRKPPQTLPLLRSCYSH